VVRIFIRFAVWQICLLLFIILCCVFVGIINIQLKWRVFAVTLVPLIWFCSQMPLHQYQICIVPAFCDDLCSVSRRPSCTAIVMLLYTVYQKHIRFNRNGPFPVPHLHHQAEFLAAHHQPHHYPVFKFHLLGYFDHSLPSTIVILWWISGPLIAVIFENVMCQKRSSCLRCLCL